MEVTNPSPCGTDGKRTHGTMLHVTWCEGNAHQKSRELPPHTRWSGPKPERRHHPMLARTQGDGNSRLFLVGMGSGAAALGDSPVASEKTPHAITTRHRSPAPRYLPREPKTYDHATRAHGTFTAAVFIIPAAIFATDKARTPSRCPSAGGQINKL